MNWTDWIIFVSFIISGLISLFQGFIREMFSLLAWLSSLAVAILFLDELANVLTLFIPFADLRVGIALVTLFFSTFLVAQWLNYLIINLLVGRTALTVSERMLGVCFGIIRGGVIVTLAIMLTGLTHLPKTQEWQESILIQYFKPIVWELHKQLPADVAKQFNFDSTPKQPVS